MFLSRNEKIDFWYVLLIKGLITLDYSGKHFKMTTPNPSMPYRLPVFIPAHIFQIRSMNGLFGLKLQITVGENMLIGIAVGISFGIPIIFE